MGPAHDDEREPARPENMDGVDPTIGTSGTARGVVLDGADPLVAGRYRIEASLGRGGMGEVFLAFDQHLRRQVALKKPRTAGPLDARELARFDREARAAAVLSHPNIVAVHDIVSEDGTPYIVMELVHGEPLSSRLAGGTRMPVDGALSVAEAVCDALAYAHRVGVVHRDVKPGNIMLTATGGVKVLDFGIARYLAAATPTDTRVPFGTPEYLSPEQIRGETVDGRADLYALGCVLYEMLTGRPPFAGDPVAVVYRHLEEIPPPPSARAPDVPEALDAIVTACLSKDPDQRPRSASELEAALRRVRGFEPRDANAAATFPVVAQTVPLAAARATIPAVPLRSPAGSATSVLPPVIVSSPGARRRPPRRRRRSVAALVAVVVLAALAGTLAWARAPGRSAAPPKHVPKAHPLILHPPTGVSAKGACDGFLRFRASLSWIPTSSPRADGYAIYRDDGRGGALRLVGRVHGRFVQGFVERGLGSSTTYRYAVRSTYGTKVGPSSPSVIGVTPLLCMA